MPTVSVLMPSYNHEKFISAAIESVLNQSFQDLELIIIDDASVDDSRAIIKAYEKKDRRIHASFHNENKGIAETLNECIHIARGTFVALFASDDMWAKGKLDTQLKVLEKDEDLVVWSEGLVIDAEGNFTGELFTEKHGASKKKKSGDIFEELLGGNFICGQSVILKREHLADIKYDTQLQYLNDYKVMLSLAQEYRYSFTREPLAMYRVHGKNSILSDREGWQIDQIKLGKWILLEYRSEISNRVRHDTLLRISRGYSHIGERRKAMQYASYAITLNPLHINNVPYLILAMTKRGGAIRSCLQWSYNLYKRCTKSRTCVSRRS